MADDQEIFDQAVAENKPETPIETPTEARTEANEGRERDDKGRFVSKAPEAPDKELSPPPVATGGEGQDAQAVNPNSQEVSTPEPHEDARVPSWRLAEEAQRRREAEAAYQQLQAEIRQMQMQMAQQRQPQQPAPEPIDPFADPTGFANSIQQQFQERLAAIQLENSLRFARRDHGDVFDKAYEAFIDHANRNRDAATYNRVMQSGDPGEALVSWYKDQELHRELAGSDLKSFIAKQQEAWMKDPSVQAKVIEAFKASQQAQPTNTITSVPPSLSRATAAQPAHDEGSVTDQRSMYAYATAKR